MNKQELKKELWENTRFETIKSNPGDWKVYLFGEHVGDVYKESDTNFYGLTEHPWGRDVENPIEKAVEFVESKDLFHFCETHDSNRSLCCSSRKEASLWLSIGAYMRNSEKYNEFMSS